MDVKSTKVKSHRRALSVPSTVHKVARKKGQVIEETKVLHLKSTNKWIKSRTKVEVNSRMTQMPQVRVEDMCE